MIRDPDNMTPDEVEQMWAEAHAWYANYKRETAGRVYALIAGDFIKIGFTKGDILVRMRKLQTGCATELGLIGTGPGGRSLERSLHTLLKDFRSHGEWFRDEPFVREMVARFCPISPLES